MMPLWAIRLIGYGLLLSAIGGGLTYLHHKIYKQGWNDREVIAVANEKKIEEEAKLALADAIDDANKRELKLSTKLSEISIANTQKEASYEDRINRLNDRVRVGDQRLSIATRSKVPQCVNSTDPAIAVQSGTETDSELMPEAVEFLTRIAADSDRHVRQLNDVIDAYDAAREACNAKITKE